MKSLKIYTVSERPPEDEEVILLIQKKPSMLGGDKIVSNIVKVKRVWQMLDEDGDTTSVTCSYKSNPKIHSPNKWKLVIYDESGRGSLNDDDLYSTTESVQSLFSN